MYVLLSGVGTTLPDLPPLRRHVPLSVFYCLIKAFITQENICFERQKNKRVPKDLLKGFLAPSRGAVPSMRRITVKKRHEFVVKYVFM